MTDEEAMAAIVAAASPWTDEEIRKLNRIFGAVNAKRLAEEAEGEQEQYDSAR